MDNSGFGPYAEAFHSSDNPSLQDLSSNDKRWSSIRKTEVRLELLACGSNAWALDTERV